MFELPLAPPAVRPGQVVWGYAALAEPVALAEPAVLASRAAAPTELASRTYPARVEAQGVLQALLEHPSQLVQ